MAEIRVNQVAAMADRLNQEGGDDELKKARKETQMQKHQAKERQQTQKKPSKKGLASMLADPKEGKKNLLKDTLYQMSDTQQRSGKKKMQRQMQKEIETMFREPSTQDQTNLSKQIQVKQDELVGEGEGDMVLEEGAMEEGFQKAAAIKESARKTQSEQVRARNRANGRVKVQSHQAQKGILKEYAQTYAQYALSQNPKHKKKMEQLKQRLSRQGLNPSQLIKTEENVASMVKQNMVYELKRNLLKHFFSQSDESRLQRIRATASYNQFALSMEKLQKRGLMKKGLHQVMDQVSSELKSEIKDYILAEVGDQVVSKALSGKSDADFASDLSKLMRVGAAANAWVSKDELEAKVRKTVDDMGLDAFVPPLGTETISHQEGGSQQDQPQKDQVELYLRQEELFEDKLRNLYMTKALGGSLKTNIQLIFKMRKLRNGLVKLGVYTEEKEKQLKKEGAMQAYIKMIGDLEDAAREQATLDALSGPVYGLIKKKKAILLKRIRKIGFRMTLDDLKKIQKEANHQMYQVIKEQVYQLNMHLEIRPSVYFSRQVKRMNGILERLREETDIYDGDLEAKQAATYTDSQIHEAAWCLGWKIVLDM